MKYSIGDEILEVLTGKISLVVATKEEPCVKNNDQYGRSEQYPNPGSDYMILFKSGEGDYKGNYTSWNTN